jgi:Zn-dependent protease with chaperone function
MRWAIFQGMPAELFAEFRASEEPALRRVLRRRAHAQYRSINAQCFGNKLPKRPQIIICGSTDDSALASARAWYMGRRRVFVQIHLDPTLDTPAPELLPGQRLRAVLIHEMAHIRVRLSGNHAPQTGTARYGSMK